MQTTGNKERMGWPALEDGRPVEGLPRTTLRPIENPSPPRSLKALPPPFPSRHRTQALETSHHLGHRPMALHPLESGPTDLQQILKSGIDDNGDATNGTGQTGAQGTGLLERDSPSARGQDEPNEIRAAGHSPIDIFGPSEAANFYLWKIQLL